MRIRLNRTLFVMIDIQERFVPHIPDLPDVIKKVNLLNKFAELLQIPLLITEQNPAGLGKTVESIYIPAETPVMTKTKFSIFEPDIASHLSSIEAHTTEQTDFLHNRTRKQIVFYGIETHVCVMQSVLEAIELNYQPIVVADAVSSISANDKKIALKRIRQEGATVVSAEMLIFELLGGAYHPNFKQVSKLVKESKQ